MPETCVITGANRGLGLEFARQLSARGAQVIGTVRRGADAGALAGAAARIEELDTGDSASVTAFGERMAGVPVDLLINNAGRQSRFALLDEFDFEELADVFSVNAFGPVRVTRVLLANLRKGTGRKVVHVTSRMGSFGDFDAASMVAYRASKAALNMFHRCIAEELGNEGILCVALHPGWVRTSMGGAEAPLSPEESVRGMIEVIDGVTRAQAGAFLDFQGEPLPW